jgi:hypothetical protein
MAAPPGGGSIEAAAHRSDIGRTIARADCQGPPFFYGGSKTSMGDALPQRPVWAAAGWRCVSRVFGIGRGAGDGWSRSPNSVVLLSRDCSDRKWHYASVLRPLIRTTVSSEARVLGGVTCGRPRALVGRSALTLRADVDVCWLGSISPRERGRQRGLRVKRGGPTARK